MNLRHWRIFLAIADNGSLSRTAEATGIGQPGLSRIIKELEASLGVELFERLPRGLSLTAAGDQFRRRATELLSEIGTLREELRAANTALAGTCALGMPPFLSTLLTVPLLRDYSANYPGVRLRVWEYSAEWVRNAIVSRHVDLGVVAYPLSHPGLVASPLLTEDICLVGPPGAELSPDHPVTLEEVSRYPLVISGRANAFRRRVESAVEAEGGRLTVGLEIEGGGSEYVRNGFGFCIVPWSGLQNKRLFGGMSMAPIAGLTVTWATVRRCEALPECTEHMLQAIVDGATARVRTGEWRASMVVSEAR